MSNTTRELLSTTFPNKELVNIINLETFQMEKQFKKQLTIWRKCTLKYRLGSSDASTEIQDILRKIRDSGDEQMVARVTKRFSKLF